MEINKLIFTCYLKNQIIISTCQGDMSLFFFLSNLLSSTAILELVTCALGGVCKLETPNMSHLAWASAQLMDGRLLGDQNTRHRESMRGTRQLLLYFGIHGSYNVEKIKISPSHEHTGKVLLTRHS